MHAEEMLAIRRRRFEDDEVSTEVQVRDAFHRRRDPSGPLRVTLDRVPIVSDGAGEDQHGFAPGTPSSSRAGRSARRAAPAGDTARPASRRERPATYSRTGSIGNCTRTTPCPKLLVSGKPSP